LTALIPSVTLGTSHISVIGHICAADLALASARTTQLMATMTASQSLPSIWSDAAVPEVQRTESQRRVLRCAHCRLVQFQTTSASCRRCKKLVEVESPTPALAPLALVPSQAQPAQGLQVATAVRDLRHVRNLSQRQLAARMNVPRTYISKIENGKAMPTLSSLNRLANALEVEMSALLRDATTRHSNETSMLIADPFLAEIAQYTSKLDSVQRSIFLNHVRELAAGRRRTA